MKLSEKIEKLNRFCKGSLCFSHHLNWEVYSYEDGTLFNVKEKLYKLNGGYLNDKTFKGVVNLAYREMLKEEANLKQKGRQK